MWGRRGNPPGQQPLNGSERWLILLFDVGLGAWLLMGAIVLGGALVRSDVPQPEWRVVLLQAVLFLSLVAAGFGGVGAAACLLKQAWLRRAVFLQRLLFWGLTLAGACCFLEALLPREGGVGGFLSLAATCFFGMFALIALGGWARIRNSASH